MQPLLSIGYFSIFRLINFDVWDLLRSHLHLIHILKKGCNFAFNWFVNIYSVSLIKSIWKSSRLSLGWRLLNKNYSISIRLKIIQSKQCFYIFSFLGKNISICMCLVGEIRFYTFFFVSLRFRSNSINSKP